MFIVRLTYVTRFKKYIFFGVPHLATCIFFFQLLKQPGLGAEIDPGMALTPFPSSIG